MAIKNISSIPSPSKPRRVAVAGATGAVGKEILSVLEQMDYPISELRLLASKRSAGTTTKFRGEDVTIEELDEKSFDGMDIALFSAGSSISKKFRQSCVDAGAVLIDNSSAFRMEEGVPLVIPEINPQDAQNHNGVIANPNCSTIIMLMAMYPVHQKYPVKRMVVSTYQAASGAGWAAMEELKESTRAALDEKPFTPDLLPYPYGFNLFSHNSNIDASGYNEEERKMINETRKILHDDSIAITASCVRVPVLRTHCETINLEFKNGKPSETETRDLINAFPGVQVVDDREKNHFPMPLESSERFDCFVGRIRDDISMPQHALDMFVAGDQLLKGAALNAVQIACLL